MDYVKEMVATILEMPLLYHLPIDNIHALLDWKLLSATVTIRVLCLIMMEDLREDYKSVLQDIFDSEKLKIDS